MRPTISCDSIPSTDTSNSPVTIRPYHAAYITTLHKDRWPRVGLHHCNAQFDFKEGSQMPSGMPNKSSAVTDPVRTEVSVGIFRRHGILNNESGPSRKFAVLTGENKTVCTAEVQNCCANQTVQRHPADE